MASQQHSDYELLTEHLGYPPVTLLDDIINTVNVLADRALDSVEKLLLSQPPTTLGFRAPKDTPKDAAAQTAQDAARREIEEGTHQLETLLTASIDRNFDKLELYAMQNILTVQPADLTPHVRLAHYQGLDFSAAATDNAEGSNGTSLESVTNLRRKVQASQRLNLALQQEKAKNDALLLSLRQVLGVKSPETIKQEPDTSPRADQPSTFGFLNDKPALSSVGSQTPITTTTEFTISQLSSLRSLSSSLRNLLPELVNAQNDTHHADGNKENEEEGDGRKKTWRSERAEYVEQSSRKYLEKNGGLELGAQGEVRDGEYQGTGRNLGRGEVEGLERVVAILGERSRSNETNEGGDNGESMDES